MVQRIFPKKSGNVKPKRDESILQEKRNESLTSDIKMYTVLCDKPGSVLNTPQINSFIMISLIILMSRY